MVMRGFAFLSVALSSSLFLLGAAVAVKMEAEKPDRKATVRVTLWDRKTLKFNLSFASSQGEARTTIYSYPSDRYEVKTTHQGDQGQKAWEDNLSYFWLHAPDAVYKIDIVHTHTDTAAVNGIRALKVLQQ